MRDTEEMKAQVSPNWYTCLPTAFAVALGVPVRDLFRELGHDGSEIVFPQEPEPLCRRAFHAQEFFGPCLRRGYAPVHVEAVPITEANGEKFVVAFTNTHIERLTAYMETYSGVVIGDKPNGTCHALAWDGKLFYNNDGRIYEDYEIQISEFVALIPVHNPISENN